MTKHYAATHPGRVRKNNEDSFFAKEYEGIGIYILADGMGGYQGGEEASKIAVETAFNCLKKAIDTGEMKASEDIKKKIKDTIAKVNKKILNQASKSVELKNMGTTMVAAIVNKDILYYSSVGDSRLYLLRKNNILSQLTIDDTYINKLISDGVITEKEAEKHPQRHVLTKAVGISKKIETEEHEIELKKGDILLLCSDGVTNMLNEHEIEDILSTPNSENIALKLINEANENGGQDNITAIVVTYN